jgi:hypothetical protein
VICPSQGRYLNTGQHKHRINAYTPNIHALNEIRTHDPGVRANEDISHLRPLGYCDWHRDNFTFPIRGDYQAPHRVSNFVKLQVPFTGLRIHHRSVNGSNPNLNLSALPPSLLSGRQRLERSKDSKRMHLEKTLLHRHVWEAVLIQHILDFGGGRGVTILPNVRSIQMCVFLIHTCDGYSAL